MMQVSRREAAQALMVLRHTQRRTAGRRRRRLRPLWRHSPSTVDPSTIDRRTIDDVYRRLLDDRNWVSIERIEAARARLEAGEEPSSDVVAEMIVRRAICDRLT
jgi:hypothetical protein